MFLDFSDQNLQGRFFKGQNLEGANFSNADIRGINFANANLTGAKFSGARAGLLPWMVIVSVIQICLLSIHSGFFFALMLI